jgi:hypothetical protein
VEAYLEQGEALTRLFQQICWNRESLLTTGTNGARLETPGVHPSEK